MAISTTEVMQPSIPNILGSLPFDIFSILRGGLLIFLFFYLVLALMVIKQMMMMMKTVRSNGNGFLLFLAYLHLFVVFATLLFTMFAL